MQQATSPFSCNHWTQNKNTVLESLKKYHTNLKPHFYNQEKVCRSVGKVFAALSALSFCGTIYASLYFVAAPQIVINVTLGLAIMTVMCAATTIFCFYKKTFWMDPEFRAKKGIEIALDISNRKLSYSQVMDQYRDEIKLYKILSNEDLSNLLYYELKNCPSYEHFIARNGKESLNVFSGDEKLELGSLFIKHLVKLKCSTAEISSRFATEIKLFNIKESHLLSLAMNEQITDVLEGKINYFDFRAKHSRIDLLALNQDQKVVIKKMFLTELKNKKSDGLLKSIKDYQKDCKEFEITNEEIQSIILSKELHEITTYANFKERNGDNSVRTLIENDPLTLITIQKKFLDSPYLLMINEKSMQDYPALQINVDKIQNRLEQDAVSCTYDDFINKHTTEIFPAWSFGDKTTANIKFKLLKKIGNESKGLLEIQKTFVKEFKALGILEFELYRIILFKEASNAKDYVEFEDRNGENAYQLLLQCNEHSKHVLSEICLKVPYQKMYHYDSIFKYLEINDLNITKAITNDAKKMDYLPFVEKHGVVVLSSNHLEDWKKEECFQAFSKIIKTCQIEKIAGLDKHAEIWHMSMDDCYKTRWTEMKMIDILNKDSLVFEEKIKISPFKVEMWKEKTLTEIKDFKICEVLKSYKRCFELNILESHSEMVLLLENEIQAVSAFDELLKIYGESIFNFKLISKDSKNLKSLIFKFLRENYKGLVEGNHLPILDIIKTYDLLPNEQSIFLATRKGCYEGFKLTYDNELKLIRQKAELSEKANLNDLNNLNNIRSTYTEKLKAAEIEKNKSATLLTEILSDVEKTELEIKKNQDKLTNFSNENTLKLQDACEATRLELEKVLSLIKLDKQYLSHDSKAQGINEALNEKAKKQDAEKSLISHEKNKNELFQKFKDLQLEIACQDKVSLNLKINNLKALLNTYITKSDNLKTVVKNLDENYKALETQDLEHQISHLNKKSDIESTINLIKSTKKNEEILGLYQYETSKKNLEKDYILFLS